MNYRYKSSSALLIKYGLIIIIIFSLLTSSAPVSSQTEFEILRLKIAYPGQIPDFHNFSTPTIVPDSAGVLKFKLRNRYKFDSDNTMRNVSLMVNIYEYATLETNKNIKKVSNSPKIVSGSDNLRTIIDRWTAEFYWGSILKDEIVDVNIDIKSGAETPEGRYFVRMELGFIFNNSYFIMRSRGHFTDDLWDKASINITDQYGIIKVGDDNHTISGRLDLDILDVDGIIPETSIRVLTPMPTWPLYVCLIPSIIMCLVLALVFYLMDERGMFPETKKRLDRWGKKIEDIRYRRNN